MQKVELTETKVKELMNQPIIENSWFKSTDDKWLVHKTIITDIKPLSYLEKVLSDNEAP
jgi:hypothetical protein